MNNKDIYYIKFSTKEELQTFVNLFGIDNICSPYFNSNISQEEQIEKMYLNGYNICLFDRNRLDCLQMLSKKTKLDSSIPIIDFSMLQNILQKTYDKLKNFKEESNKELNGFNYSYSSYIPNAICINDIIRTFSQDGLKISECEDINNTFVMTTEYIPEEIDYEL